MKVDFPAPGGPAIPTRNVGSPRNSFSFALASRRWVSTASSNSSACCSSLFSEDSTVQHTHSGLDTYKSRHPSFNVRDTGVGFAPKVMDRLSAVRLPTRTPSTSLSVAGSICADAEEEAKPPASLLRKRVDAAADSVAACSRRAGSSRMPRRRLMVDCVLVARFCGVVPHATSTC